MRYWYTVIFLVLGVFILMAIIIKICGKKTPLVRSRRFVLYFLFIFFLNFMWNWFLKHLIYYRKQRRRTIQHAQEVIDNPDDVQVHPTAIEPSVPLGNNFWKNINFCAIFHNFHDELCRYVSSNILLVKMICHNIHIWNLCGLHVLCGCVSSNVLVEKMFYHKIHI